ncbi:MAG: anhydro-N-acetylmuramic acid kinase [Thermoproteota archaeon]
MQKKVRTIVGLMSGTSADGVTAVLVKIRGNGLNTKLKTIMFRNYKYPPCLREEIFELFDPETSTVEKICNMNFVLGEFFATCVVKLAKESKMDLSKIDLVGSHGQTVYHVPVPKSTCGFLTRSTLQIGELAIIAERTGITTIGDFRKRDMAAGGEGAPLTPYLDFILHRHPKFNRVLQNIGGIANLTFLPANASRSDVIAFDTGPGNMIIDSLMRYYTNGKLNYDDEGRVAAQGSVDEHLLKELLADPYFKKKPPKTTGRELFGKKYTEKIIGYAKKRGLAFKDVISTTTAFTIETITMAYEKFIMPFHTIDEVYVSGGGSRNKTIMQGLKERLEGKGIKVFGYDRLGIPSEAKEAVLMAVLANEYIMGNPSNIRSATGAKRNAILGTLVLGNA